MNRTKAVATTAGIALLLGGCGSGEDGADQAAIDQARQEGAQAARQNERIRELEREVKKAKSEAQEESVPVGDGSTGAGGSDSAYVPTYVPYSPSDPGYAYIAEIPSGGGWSTPVESQPTSGDLLRTSLRGPDGTLLIIDYTPSEVPQLGGSYDSVDTSLQTNFGPATEYVFSESEGLADCNGRPCADFLVNDGAGGGWGVLGGGPSLPVAEDIAAHVAQSLDYGGGSGGGSAPVSQAGCDPNYTGCVPPYPPDVDCIDVGQEVDIIGDDVHNLDIGGDGEACEFFFR